MASPVHGHVTCRVAAVKATGKLLVPCLIVVALIYVFLGLGMEISAR